MGKIEDAKEILKALGLPVQQQNEMSSLILLALCGITKETPWRNAARKSMTITKDIMQFVADQYDHPYAPNTRETFRRQVLHQFVQGSIADYNPDNPDLPTNSPKAHYAISHEALSAIKSFGTAKWESRLQSFLGRKGKLIDNYEKRRELTLVPVTLPLGKEVKLSPGKHNELQADVVKKFGSLFVKGGFVLYLGDTAQKNLILEQEELEKLNIQANDHDKLPDIILYDQKRDWLFLIEAVTSHGPMSPKRIRELEDWLTHCNSHKVFVSAFPNFAEFKKHLPNIAWETEVWISEFPEHLIHFNGDKFLTP